MLYQIREGSVSLGGELILDHIHFEIRGKEKIAVVGKNGCGKTTLLKLIAGRILPDQDDKLFQSVIWTAEHVSIGMLEQQPFRDKSRTVVVEMESLFDDEDPYSREKFDREQEFRRIFTGMGFALDDMKKPISCFSGGEQTKIALIRLFLTRPDILLLDEPTNHLDIETTRFVESAIREYPGAVVMVSHDRFFLDQTAKYVCEIEGRRIERYPGNYTAFRKKKQEITEARWKRYKAQQEEIHRLTQQIERFKHKPKKASMARSKKSYLDRMEIVEKPRDEQVFHFPDKIIPLNKGSKQVLMAKDLVIGYLKDQPVLHLDYSLRRGRKVGVIGENGIGKSTLMKTLAGILPPLSGTLHTGNGIETGYYDQQVSAGLETFDRNGKTHTVLSWYRERFPDLDEGELRSSLGHYLFSGDEVMKPVSALSGGEKGRLKLAQLLESRPNLLLLDEPTNHMDIPARETIESALQSYTGTLVFVTHDRYFLRQVAESLVILDRDGISWYPFGYEHYLERMRKREEGGEGGLSPVEAENTLLVESLHAVPKKERLQSARFSTEQSYTDWQLQLALRQMREAEERLNEYMIRTWEETEEFRLLEKDLLDKTLFWYDKWIDYQKAFAGYRDA